MTVLPTGVLLYLVLVVLERHNFAANSRRTISKGKSQEHLKSSSVSKFIQILGRVYC